MNTYIETFVFPCTLDVRYTDVHLSKFQTIYNNNNTKPTCATCNNEMSNHCVANGRVKIPTPKFLGSKMRRALGNFVI